MSAAERMDGMDAMPRRLHAEIVRALDESRPAWRGTPITVAEIYQDLAPYRSMRAALGIDLNADYEYALLRLLAGAGGLARVEPEEAREELAREAESSNPDLSVVRRFAACDVWIEPLAGDAGTAPAQRVTAAPAEPEVLPQTPATAPAEPPRAAPAAVVAAETAADRCIRCAARLPGDREIRFCPHCGTDQRLPRCPSCGEDAEPGWRFCAACGAQLAESPVA